MSAVVLEPGTHVRFAKRTWTVVMLEGPCVKLIDADNSVATVLANFLFADPDFEVVGAPQRSVPPFGLLEELPEQVRARAYAWERHVREVETGCPVPGQDQVPRPEFDPARRSMAEREEAKAAELTAAGQPASAVTVRRMRARYREDGLWGLVDGRAARPRSPVGRADERVVAAIEQALQAQKERSTGTLSRLRRTVGWILEDAHGVGAVQVPPASTFNRLVHALADRQGLLGTAAQRRMHSSRPAPPFTPTVALRPGELVMLDSTPLDVMVVLADGVTGKAELTIGLDVATRSICATVLRPMGTGSVDAAILLAQMATPMRMRPGWEAALAMSRSVIPYQRLVSLDARLEGAAARPVIMPETVVVDQGSVFISASFTAACDSLGCRCSRRRRPTARPKGMSRGCSAPSAPGSRSTWPATPARTSPSAARPSRTRRAGPFPSCRTCWTSGWSPTGSTANTRHCAIRWRPSSRCHRTRCGPRWSA
ncbi:hypothetical protein [Streptomyces sp. NBC_01190]|uniref:hypothetical protein n=1 Tax=Streptomyces sp. NBC_01190 TaxID=2903767 RepID=UPI0038640CC4|nr:hypothetical protein OG519_00085 [Streptomyces sp. NBC_01190]WSS24135.1 hypothetical protein OG519_33965 [Streptomyces sp. NBC_01190]